MHSRTVRSLILCLVLLSPAASGQIPQPMLGEKAPGFELETIEGDTLSLRGLQGQYLVIHFGASW